MKTVEEAYREYHKWLETDKARLILDLERALIAMKMWNVDVVRKHDGAVGRLKVFDAKTPNKDPSIQFFRYLNTGKPSKHYTGKIPTKNTEAYIKDLFTIYQEDNEDER